MNWQPQSNGATAARTRESQDAHWYTVAGEPRHSVPKKDGKGDRPTTVTDARKNNWLPSVTTVLKILAKPALVNWQIEQACLAIISSPRRENEQVDAFVHRVLQVDKEHERERDKAGEWGTQVHAAIERSLAEPAALEAMEPELKRAAESVLSLDVVKGSRTVASELRLVGDGYAGTTDYLGESADWYELLDFKNVRTIPNKEPWIEHSLQASAYANALYEPNADARLKVGKTLRCWVVYVSTTVKGLVVPMLVDDWPGTYENGFAPLVKHWQFRNKYRPTQ